MKTGMILRIGIHLLGVWLVVTALTGGTYQVMWYVTMPEFGREEYAPVALAAIYGHFVCPLVLAVLAFAGAGRVERWLLGREGDAAVSLGHLTDQQLLRIGLKILGLYFVAAYGAALVATVFEMLTIEAGSRSFDRLHAFSDLIANVLAFAAGLVLVTRTELVAGKTMSDAAKAGASGDLHARPSE